MSPASGRLLRRTSALIGATVLAIAPIAPPGPTGPAAASLGGPPGIETLGIAPLVGEFTVAGQPLDHLVIVWDEILDRSSVPAATDFTVTINNVDHVPTQVAHLYAGAAGESFAFGADGTSFMRIDLPTNPSVTYSIGDSVFLDYHPAPDATPIRDLALTPAEPFPDPVEVLAEDIGAFSVLTSVIDSFHGANKLVLVLSDPIVPASLPAASQFAVRVGVDTIGVSSVADLHPELGMAFLELTLTAPITDPGAIIELDYTSIAGRLVSRYRAETLATFANHSVTVLLADTVSGTLAVGESIGTAPVGGQTPEDPVGAEITAASAGPASIEEGLREGIPPAGYAFFGQEFDISMPDAPSADEPNVLTFVLDASMIPAGEDESTIELFRDGVLVPECNPLFPGSAVPSPCVSDRSVDENGDAVLTVLTIQASTWNTAIVPSYEFGGFLPPVDSGIPNLVKAGRAIPVRFSLGGDRGLSIFEAGSPSVRQIGCADLDDSDLVEETVTAAGSSLTYHAGSDTYQYVWKTSSSWAGSCRRLEFAFTDGSSATAAFDFRK